MGLRGSVAPDAGLFTAAVREIEDLLRQAGVADAPLGVDIAEPLMICELQRQGFTVADGQHVMLDARQIKSADEIMLLSTAAAMVDGVYFDIAEALRPGVRENELVALANKRLYEMVPATSRASTRSPGNAATPTAPSPSAPPHRRSRTRTSSAGSGSTPQSISFDPVSVPTSWLGPGRRPRTSSSPASTRPSACSSVTASASPCTSGRSSAD